MHVSPDGSTAFIFRDHTWRGLRFSEPARSSFPDMAEQMTSRHALALRRPGLARGGYGQGGTDVHQFITQTNRHMLPVAKTRRGVTRKAALSEGRQAVGIAQEYTRGALCQRSRGGGVGPERRGVRDPLRSGRQLSITGLRHKIRPVGCDRQDDGPRVSF